MKSFGQIVFTTLFIASLTSSNPVERNFIVTPDQNSLVGSTSISSQYADTIKEVETLLQTNPNLPRLTRGEILDIIQNITLEDGLKSVTETVKNNRKEKAVMVVLPYSPKDDADALELYTKPPITRLIDNDEKPMITTSSTTTTTTTLKPTTSTETATKPTVMKIKPNPIKIKPRPPVMYQRYPASVKPSSTQSTFTQPPTTHVYQSTSMRRRPIYTTIPTQSTIIPVYSPLPPPKSNSFKPLPSRPKPRPNEGFHMINPPKFEGPRSTKLPPLKKVPVNNLPLPSDFKDVLTNLDVLIQHEPKSTSPVQRFSTLPPQKIIPTTAIPNIDNVANNLSPDMQELLAQFGLIPSKDSAKQPKLNDINSLQPISEVNADSYASFKPLPTNSQSEPSEDMDEFLAQFGLGSNNRKEKSIKESSNTKNSISKTKDVYANQDELKRLNKLMDIIKQLEKLNGTVSDEDLKHVDLEDLHALVNSFNTQSPTSVPLIDQKVPDLLEEQSQIADQKNEVKRQSSTTQNPSLALLESFGGDEIKTSVETQSKNVIKQSEVSTTEAEEIVTTTTEAPKRSGFYYLVDWNSFFEIDNQKGKSVNLRFQPKIGDPKRFYNVQVP